MARHGTILCGGRLADINTFVDARRPRAAHDRGVRRLVIPSALAALAACALGATPAAAAEDLSPGTSEQLTVRLPAGWAGVADRLGVSVSGVVQLENGCLHPEEQAGDRSCGGRDGELAEQLIASVAAGTLDDGTCSTPGPRTALALLGGGQTRLSVTTVDCLSVELAFPDGPDDDLAQSDALQFQLDIAAEGPGGVIGGGDAAVVGGSSESAAPAAAGPAPAAAGPAGADPDPAAGPVAGAVAAGGTTAGAGAGAGVGSGAGAAAPPPAGTPLGEVQAEVQIGGTGAQVRTESATRSLGDLALLVGGLFLVAVALGWVLLLAWRRRSGRAA
jgi:hypothetical protein